MIITFFRTLKILFEVVLCMKRLKIYVSLVQFLPEPPLR